MRVASRHFQAGRGRLITAACRLSVSAALMLGMVVAPATARAQNPPSEADVKAVFLWNFAKFVEWPEGAFREGSAPLVVGVSGDDVSIIERLVRMTKDERVNGRPIAIRAVRTPPDLDECHIVFVTGSDRRRIERVLEAARHRHVLTVGETAGFATAGGIINFFKEDYRVRFEINPAAADRAGLRISSRLLGLARIIGTAAGRREE